MAEEFKKGDQVQLKSGGPIMTVSNIGEYMGDPCIWCIWFVATKKQEDVFPVETVRKTANQV